MSAAKETDAGEKLSYRIPTGHVWDNAWKIAAAVAVVGFVFSALGFSSDPGRFGYAWIFAFVTFLTVALGGIFFVLMSHLARASWSVTVRRTAEFMAQGVVVFLFLFIPILASMGHVYEWAGDHGGDEHAEIPTLVGSATAVAQDHAAEEALGAEGVHHTPQQEALHHHLMEHKSGWLGSTGFVVRGFIYIFIWIFLALFYFRKSTEQDRTKSLKLTNQMQWFAPLGLILFGTSLTFAMFDWMMSLEPTWYSTIYGVYVWAGSVVTIYAMVIVVTMSLRARGLLGNAVNKEHFHDLGKLCFGFVVFWAYAGFSQMMLIWYANIPEETAYYHLRWHGEGWRGVSIVIVVFHFILPFLFLMSRNVKRRLPMLGFGCMWLLVLHVVDIYWFVLPSANESGALDVRWIDLAALMAVGGTYFAYVFFQMRRYPLIPIGDPRLERALHFVST